MFGNIFNQSVPGQLYHVALNGGHCVLAESAPELDGLVFYYWLIQIEDQQINLEVIPDGAFDVVFSPWMPEFAIVYLPAIEKFDIPLQGPACYAGISFEPEAAQHFFDITLETFSSLEVGIETIDCLNMQQLVADIQGVMDIQQIKQLFDKALISRNHQPQRRFGQSAYQQFIESLESGSVQKIAAKVGISERQFRRTIHDISGLAPKKVQRIVRLQQLLHELFGSSSLPSEDAVYDESHRIQELKELTGMTYGELRRMSEIYNSWD